MTNGQLPPWLTQVFSIGGNLTQIWSAWWNYKTRRNDLIQEKFSKQKDILESQGVQFPLCIENGDEFIGYLVHISERVNRELEDDKIEHWKNAIFHLGIDFQGFEYKSNFLMILQDLSVFDLSVLHIIYTRSEHIIIPHEIIKCFSKSSEWDFQSIESQMVLHSIQKLAHQSLIQYGINVERESIFDVSVSGISESYVKSELGKTFLKFVSDEFEIKY